jgi:hypothetical protein
MLFLVLQKNRKRKICRHPTPPDTPSNSDTDIAVPFIDDSTEENKEQDADCVFCTGRYFEDHSEEDYMRCMKCFRWAQKLCGGMDEDFVCETCQGKAMFCS